MGHSGTAAASSNADCQGRTSQLSSLWKALLRSPLKGHDGDVLLGCIKLLEWRDKADILAYQMYAVGRSANGRAEMAVGKGGAERNLRKERESDG